MNIDFSKYINLQNIPQDQQAQFINSITDLVMARMADMIGNHLSESEVIELESLAESRDQNKILAWLNKTIPNFAQGLNEVLAEESAELGAKVALLSDYSYSQG